MFAIYLCLLAEAEDLEYIVGDVIVVYIFTFMLLHVFYYTDGQRQYYNSTTAPTISGFWIDVGMPAKPPQSMFR